MAGFFQQRRERRQLERANLAEIQQIAVAALADDILTAAEEHELGVTLERKGWTMTQFVENLPDLHDELLIAKINDGRLPVETGTMLMPQRGEVVHAEVSARLAKEVTRKEFRGGSSGFSIPLGGGIRYRTGQNRGRMVTLGTEIVVADTGTLAITSKRAVFQGQRRNLQFPHAKLDDMRVYNDAIQLAVSSRQQPSTIWVPKAQIVAALINAAANVSR